eukprot:357379-Chlamydomonas_euryale.AAC.3
MSAVWWASRGRGSATFVHAAGRVQEKAGSPILASKGGSVALQGESGERCVGGDHIFTEEFTVSWPHEATTSS